MQAQLLQDYLGICGEFFELVPGCLGADDLEELDLVELVQADQAAGVAAVAAGLTPPAGRVGGIAKRQT